MKRKFAILFKDVKLEALLSGMDDSARATYKMAWSGWGRFYLPETYLYR